MASPHHTRPALQTEWAGIYSFCIHTVAPLQSPCPPRGEHESMATEGLLAARLHIRRIIDLLRTSANEEWAKNLEDRLASMDGWFATKEQLFQIGQLCNPKALGDCFIPGMTAFEWIDEVGRLNNCCARSFNELECAGPKSTF